MLHVPVNENQSKSENNTMGPSSTDNYSQTNAKGITYHLNSKLVVLRGGKEQRIFYFSKDQRDTACPLPAGFEVKENPRNGFLTLKRV